MQGGQGQGGVLPAPRVVGSGAPLDAVAAVAALVVVVVVVTVVFEDDGLRFTSRRYLGLLPGI